MGTLIRQISFDFLLAGAKRAALYVGWSQARHGTEARAAAPQAPNTKLSITHSFFELQSPVLHGSSYGIKDNSEALKFEVASIMYFICFYG